MFLCTQYFGWEESDYGNLAMVKGVVDHGFLNYDMNHLPMYYFLSAIVMSLIGNATIAAVSVSMCAGVLTVLLGFLLTDRLSGRRAAWTVGVLLIFQPELALYSASSLREPVYAAAVLGTLLALTHERLILASLIAGAAFLTRMDALPILAPVLLIHAIGKPDWGPRVAKAILPLVLAVVGWSFYCKLHPEYQTFAFWGHSVAVNLETGGSQGGESLGAWVGNGVGVAGGLFLKVLSGRMGLGVWLALIVGFLSTPWNRHSARRTVALSGLLLLGFWLATGFLAQHELGHNLYWKWLHGPLPVLFVVSVPILWAGADRLAPALGAIGSRAVLGLVLVQSFVQMSQQTQFQLAQSEKINRPQLELARWIENETAEEAVLIIDNIPERWLSRRDHKRRFLSWMDLSECPEQGGSCKLEPLALGNLLFEEGVSYVLWFKERWTMGPIAAPYLGGADRMDLGKVSLNPLRMDRIDEVDGWVFYEVAPREN
jgi:4-amino-4-deoxy-L-arabinose transferase-like glycosyltransferase